jgi:transcriptional regulator with XRE-family HTH domain
MRLKKLRTARGMSQDALAEKANITREYVNKLEAGRYDPTVSVVQRLAKALKVSVAELVE